MKALCVLAFAALCSSTLGAKLPSDFEVCKGTEVSKVDECLKGAIQKALPKVKNGIPDLKVSELEPLYVASATIGAGKGGAVDVVQNYKDIRMHGFSSAKVTDVKFKLSEDKKSALLTINTVCPDFSFDGRYDINGKLLLLPIAGEGPFKINATNFKVDLAIKIDFYEKKGKEHMKVTEIKTKLEPEHAVYRFDNLFNGNVVLGEQLNKVLNDNWKEIFEDVEEGYEAFISSVLLSYTNSIFSKVPREELIP